MALPPGNPRRPYDLDAAASVPADAAIIVDDGTYVQKATPAQIVGQALPLASELEARAGADNAKYMSALRVSQAIGENVGGVFQAPDGADHIGYVRPGAAAVPRTLQDRGHDRIHVRDSGVQGSASPGSGPDETTALKSALADAKARKIGQIDFSGGTYINTTSAVLGAGMYNNGRNFYVNGNGATITRINPGDAFILGDMNDPGWEYGLRWHVDGLNFARASNVDDGAAIVVDQAANVRIRNAWIQNWKYGVFMRGGLLSTLQGVEIRQSSEVGYRGGFQGAFAPNANLIFDSRFTKNRRALKQTDFPNGALTVMATQIEGNNLGGTDADGVRVCDFTNAGYVNFAFCHLEGNPGQYSMYYAGAYSNGLLVLGSELIQTGHTGVQMEAGCFTGISSRITGKTNHMNFSGTSSGVLINVAGNISGPRIGNVLSMFAGRLAFGAQPGAGDPLIRSTNAATVAASGIVTQWAGDAIQERFMDAGGARIGYRYWNNGSAFGYASDTDIPFRVAIQNVRTINATKTAFGPGVDNAISAGTASLRYSQVYATNGVINTSDRRAKRDIAEIDDRVLDAWSEVEWRQYRMRQAVADKGGGARVHFGAIAQDVIDAFGRHGLNAMQYGIVCHDEWDGGDIYGLRYDECFALEAALMRRELKRLRGGERNN